MTDQGTLERLDNFWIQTIQMKRLINRIRARATYFTLDKSTSSNATLGTYGSPNLSRSSWLTFREGWIFDPKLFFPFFGRWDNLNFLLLIGKEVGGISLLLC